MNILKRINKYMYNNPYLKPYLLMWIRKTTKTINKWPQDKFIAGVMDCYNRRMGYIFDINHPKLFTEKLQWYKVFFHHDDFGRITDKALFKEYVKEHLGDGYTIPMYACWDNIKDIEKDWDKLPNEFVLKSNLQSDGRHIKIIHNKSEISFNKLKKELKIWMKPFNTLLNSWDWRFYNSSPKILAEEYMENFDNLLYDYKMFCFNGEPYCMYVARNDFSVESYPITFYDLKWNKINVKYGTHKNANEIQPSHFIEMIEISKKLSKGFPFVRVDFFDTPNHLYIAEMTFAPGGGCTPYDPVSFNQKLGDKLVL